MELQVEQLQLLASPPMVTPPVVSRLAHIRRSAGLVPGWPMPVAVRLMQNEVRP